MKKDTTPLATRISTQVRRQQTLLSLTLTTMAVPQLSPLRGGAVMPIWSILNQPLPLPSQAVKAPEHLYIQTMTGPCLCVHWPQMAVMFCPAAIGALRAADVPPLQVILASVTLMMGL